MEWKEKNIFLNIWPATITLILWYIVYCDRVWKNLIYATCTKFKIPIYLHHRISLVCRLFYSSVKLDIWESCKKKLFIACASRYKNAFCGDFHNWTLFNQEMSPYRIKAFWFTFSVKNKSAIKVQIFADQIFCQFFFSGRTFFANVFF